jgi:hypothetical protein
LELDNERKLAEEHEKKSKEAQRSNSFLKSLPGMTSSWREEKPSNAKALQEIEVAASEEMKEFLEANPGVRMDPSGQWALVPPPKNVPPSVFGEVQPIHVSALRALHELSQTDFDTYFQLSYLDNKLDCPVNTAGI